MRMKLLRLLLVDPEVNFERYEMYGSSYFEEG